MNRKRTSIIMPLYNAKKYLSEALQSVQSQTDQDFELICIDDRSTDGTRDILEEFRIKDGRIRILANEEHSGAALSRNKGLQAAEGEYIVFLDGDDIFEEELLEKAGGAMEQHRADMVLFEYCHARSETITAKKVIERPEGFEEKYCKRPFSMDTFQPREFLWWASSPCNRMFRRSFLEECRLEFQNLPSSNDVYFAQMSLFCAKRIICLEDRRAMIYVRDHLEPQRISNNRSPMCSYNAMEQLCRELKERGMIGKYAPYLYYRLPAYFMQVLAREKREERKKSFYDYLHKQGILRCIEYGKEQYELTDAYDRYLLKSFQKHEYESRWFEHPDTYFQLYLKKNGSVVCEFVDQKIAENQRVVLWGAGVNGKILLDYLTEHGSKLSGLVDGDRAKQGTSVGGYVVTDPAVSIRAADYIIVTSKPLYQAAGNAVKHTGAVVVDLLEMLTERKKDG